MAIVFNTEKRKLQDLIEYEYNPRFITKLQYQNLKRSIEKFGLAEIPCVNKDNIIIAGHQRIKILREIHPGEHEIDVRVPNKLLTEEEFQEYNIRSNKNTGQFDIDILANAFELDELVDWGFTEKDLHLDMVSPDEFGNIDDDKIPEIKESKCKAGDIWKLGEHRLMCGDSTKESDVEKLMNGKKADMVFTDPPYGLGGYGGRKNMDLKNDDGSYELIKSFYNLPIYDKVKEVYIWGNHINLLKHIEKQPKDTIVWKKNNFGLGKGYRGQYELCFYYGDFNGSDSNVWEVKRDTNYLHPTQKPIDLILRAIKNSNPKNVLDLFLGSGSTLIGCEKTNRICCGMELDTKYCDVIIERWEQFTGQKAEKL